MNQIKAIEPGSIAEELELEIGDKLIAINGEPVVDIIDYMFLTNDEAIEVEIEKSNGEHWILEIDKEYDETLGIEFENPSIDEAKRCSNNCLFCFIDQLPKGMRDSLYFKDDDSRLSFLQGNFVTLTNLKDHDIDRIIRYRISPINVSVHTTNPELRIKMLGNRFADNILERIKKLTEGGITINAQIVLCPGYNDGIELKRTLDDLMTFFPHIHSVAIVPIGLTEHRSNLPEMKGFDEHSASQTIKDVHEFQNKALSKLKTRFAFLADEFYILSNQAFPSNEAYEAYIQHEDGIGMIRKLMTEIEHELKQPMKGNINKRNIALITGVAAAPFLRHIADQIEAVFSEIKIEIIKIDNHFFGEKITVAGLITGSDIMNQTPKLVNPNQLDAILLPEAMFRAQDDVLLDDITLEELNRFFGKPVLRVQNSGENLLWHILHGGKNV